MSTEEFEQRLSELGYIGERVHEELMGYGKLVRTPFEVPRQSGLPGSVRPELARVSLADEGATVAWRDSVADWAARRGYALPNLVHERDLLKVWTGLHAVGTEFACDLLERRMASTHGLLDELLCEEGSS